MRPKSIIILILLFILVVVAGRPLGAILIDVGNFLVKAGQQLQGIRGTG